MTEEISHIIFDGNKMIISPDIVPIFNFLMEIEKEMESFLGFNQKLNGIRESHLELLNFTKFLSEKLKDNNINFQYTFKEHPEKIADKLNFHIPLRSQIIVLFASLDVLFNLHTAYEKETADEDNLRELTMDTANTKKFLNEFLLTEKNQYYRDHIKRLSKIDSTKIRSLRNSLTHFFSIGHGGLSLVPTLLDTKARKLEDIFKQNKKGNVVFISPEDLYRLIKNANMLRIIKWSEDCQKDNVGFKNKIRFVVELVEKEGAVIVPYTQLNI